jgi:membrane protease YdiL (CAAX protease family)
MRQTNHSSPTARSAVLALLLLAPVPTVGVAVAMYTAPGPAGQLVFAVAKIWLVAFPALWYLTVEGGRAGWSPPRRGGFATAFAIGALMAAVIAITYLVGRSQLVDPSLLRQTAGELRLDRAGLYLAGAGYWIFVNSVIEEYVYRWFVLRQLRALMTDGLAVVGSAVVFTVHHTVAMADYLQAGPNALATLGVFSAGACWSWLYLRYRSIWIPWIAHAIADVAIFVIGWHIIFG